jgi:hypothetical protein
MLMKTNLLIVVQDDEGNFHCIEAEEGQVPKE